ncbi:hypothetical protein HBJ16_004851 [Pseudomonas sp. CES]|uniref:Uncharacterized protein n=1 Tax=Pseudomonas taiwanensis SJ9 TaxID=1388762 RepID=V7D9T0_9PSED|nr:hypothetical protein O164_14140 [Pseudomonas taiwanensis SJ9]KAF4557572.1 hypothetical protein HBJ16_004851 [Pseudomonas sp. CES]
MSNEGSDAMLAWRNRFLQNGTLCEDRYHEAWQDAEQLERSRLISVEQWIGLTKLANRALHAGEDAPSL